MNHIVSIPQVYNKRVVLFVCAADPGMEMAQMGGLSSRRSSEVIQALTPESQEAAPQRRKKKKKAATVGKQHA